MTVGVTGRRLGAPLVLVAALISGCASTSSQSPKEAPASTIDAEPAPVAAAETPAKAPTAATSKPVQQRVRPGTQTPAGASTELTAAVA